ncbi:MAG: substrate-binding domain-containing protein, partial [Gammaproteobacteria bacterium]|nr:substrate-binding domain-containing protein [Gammaproteobacteria bacterium]
ALICGSATSLLTKDRELGFRAAMHEAQRKIEQGWVVNGDLSVEGAIRATRSLLNHRRRPSAIFCTTDEMAIGCLHAIKSAGLSVPADISVMGFDDTRYAAVMDPPLSTISQPAVEIGERVMYRLCREIDQGRGAGNSEGKPELVPHRLIIRESIAPPADLG